MPAADEQTSEREPCPVCERGPFAIKGCLVLDVLQVEGARKRWQWATLDAGANDCPVCVQIPQGDSR